MEEIGNVLKTSLCGVAKGVPMEKVNLSRHLEEVKNIRVQGDSTKMQSRNVEGGRSLQGSPTRVQRTPKPARGGQEGDGELRAERAC